MYPRGVKISVVTPNFNGGRFLDDCVRSVAAQRSGDVEVEHIVWDGGSTDGSLDVLDRHAASIVAVVSEPDMGPADAINKALTRTTGDVLAWLNADDRYYPGALARVATTMARHAEAALCFGHCPIIDADGDEIRRPITRFKEAFYPINSRFVLQCVNYLSQPAMFFRRSAWAQAGPLRTDLTAAWDYEFVLRLLRVGPAVRVGRPPLAAFRWTPESISGSGFVTQFREEYEAARADAGKWSVQAGLHAGVRWGIVAIYSLMKYRRDRPA